MAELTAQRTLVKSPPELWSELSDLPGLSKYLGAFGAIRITKLEPEQTIVWEGDHGSGTVSIEASGWGTKVTMAAAVPEADESPPDRPTPGGDAASGPPAPRRRGLLARLFDWRPEGAAAWAQSQPAEPTPGSSVARQTLGAEAARMVLDEALEALGAAHHRPFSRA